MKAVILAGGEGTRLRPISCQKPKPMVNLFDKPVLEHIIGYLRRMGITDIGVTLRTMPYAVSDHFGDGSLFGVRLRYAVEKNPLGTAGGVKACLPLSGLDEDILVISGDAVLDLDLRPALALHHTKGALATLVLHRQPQPLEYGLVMTDGEGRVTRFIEKPSWGQVFCDTVNTGVYILHPETLARIPDNQPFDFARDLFPRMLRDHEPLYAAAAEGYWCDMGDADAYRQCCFDALDDKVYMETPAPLAGDRVWSLSPLPPDIRILPPCYIGPDVYLGRGVILGPYAVVGQGCFLGDRAQAEHSVLEGVQMDADTRAQGAVAGRGTVLRAGARLCEGAVLGENVVVGEHAVVGADARIWPGKEIEPGAHVFGSLTAGHRRRPAVFDGQGQISGQPNVDVTPDFCLHLGAAAADLASRGQIGLGWAGGEAARVAALALETGGCAAGGQAVRHDAATPAAAAFAAADNLWPLSFFVSQQAGRLDLSCFEGDGLPLRHLFERKLDGAVARGELMLAHTRGIGGRETVDGVMSRYAQAAGADAVGAPLVLSVPGEHLSAALLRETLTGMGCQLSAGGGPSLRIDRAGFTLTADDEQGRVLPYERLQAILAVLAWEAGAESVALPYNAPATLDLLAVERGRTLLRLGRDGGAARRRLSALPQFRDALFAAAALARAMGRSGLSLAALSDRLPPFAVSVAEVGLRGDRGAVMRQLAAGADMEAAELFDGLRARVGSGWVHVAPLPGRRALRIAGEAADAETAEELCAAFRKRAKAMDN
ncbi:MAG: NTP transferase domain-containing protein [Oscillospiraceae bacterium]|jgi:mannose-1-phosphate guanylyltransferase/phosphomannomutase|nr:NTP transferase domain-containing protein [Oscillospiraceae bacterium]